MQVTHVANPVYVNASQIVRIKAAVGHDLVSVYTQDGPALIDVSKLFAGAVGDYVVTQQDGYACVVPKRMFEMYHRAFGGHVDLEMISCAEA